MCIACRQAPAKARNLGLGMFLSLSRTTHDSRATFLTRVLEAFLNFFKNLNGWFTGPSCQIPPHEERACISRPVYFDFEGN